MNIININRARVESSAYLAISFDVDGIMQYFLLRYFNFVSLSLIQYYFNSSTNTLTRPHNKYDTYRREIIKCHSRGLPNDQYLIPSIMMESCKSNVTNIGDYLWRNIFFLIILDIISNTYHINVAHFIR